MMQLRRSLTRSFRLCSGQPQSSQVSEEASRSTLGGRRATIFAVSTGSVERSGICVVRVSGPAAWPALRALTSLARPPPERRLCLARIGTGLKPTSRGAAEATGEPASKSEEAKADESELMDEALVALFRGPRSATGEDVAEFHLHGSPAVVAAVLEGLAGLPETRPAHAGEFVRRAWEAGKVSAEELRGLSQLLHARTAAQRRLALRALQGTAHRRLRQWRQRLVTAAASLDAFVDFAEEEHLHQHLLDSAEAEAAAVAAEVEASLEAERRAKPLLQGLSVVICGAPNVGKSSLLNRLCGRGAALVSSVAGTTRDLVEVGLDVGGVPVALVDTAGLRGAPGDDLERQGASLAAQRARSAEVSVWVLDASRPESWDAQIAELHEKLSHSAPEDRDAAQSLRLLVLNKADLLAEALDEAVVEALRAKAGAAQAFLTSASQGSGAEELLSGLSSGVAELAGSGGTSSAVVVEASWRDGLQRSLSALRDATAALPAQPDMASAHLSRTLSLLPSPADPARNSPHQKDVLDHLFASFCIGK